MSEDEMLNIGEPMVHLDMKRKQELALRLASRIHEARSSGQHLWTSIVLFYVTPWEDSVLMDHENLAHFPNLGCYLCEQPYEKRLRDTKCPGGAP